MMNGPSQRGISRRDFQRWSAGALAAPLLGTLAAGSEPGGKRKPRRPSAGDSRHGLNILFIFTDQERYAAKWPAGLSLPAHERLQQTLPFTFEN